MLWYRSEHTYIHIHTYIRRRADGSPPSFSRWYTGEHTYIHTYVHTHTHTYKGKHTYIHTYIHTHTHTYTHTGAQTVHHRASAAGTQASLMRAPHHSTQKPHTWMTLYGSLPHCHQTQTQDQTSARPVCTLHRHSVVPVQAAAHSQRVRRSKVQSQCLVEQTASDDFCLSPCTCVIGALSRWSARADSCPCRRGMRVHQGLC